MSSHHKLRMYKFLVLNMNSGEAVKFHNTMEICNKFGISKGTIYNIINNKYRNKPNKLAKYNIQSIREPYILTK